jgi:3-methyladenine DNA glycosylase AlkD
MLSKIKKDIRSSAYPAKAEILKRFFKTGPGQYGEGDKFLGVVVPVIRKFAKKYSDLELGQTVELLHSGFHEERLAALFIMVGKYSKGSFEEKEAIYKAYLSNTKYINNWDLVDLTADRIIGAYLDNKSKRKLFELAASADLFERRIAMLSCFHYIKKGKAETALLIADKLLYDSHDLIQKAVGWMLREIGKRCSEEALEEYLEIHAVSMPRTTLRYSIERLNAEKKIYFLSKKKIKNDLPKLPC